MIVHVDVTQDDLDNGTPLEPASCPVYLALICTDWGRQQAQLFVTTRLIIYRNKGSNLKRYRKIPREVSSAIKDFDAGKAVKPFSFDIEFRSWRENP